jgi:hypothetical protein
VVVDREHTRRGSFTSGKPVKYSEATIEALILTIRGQRVILDCDLAAVYGVSTKRLNEQVKRNAGRFPADFAFQLTPQELLTLKSQIATSSYGPNRSQFATGSQKHRDPRYLPYAFTEHGSIMAANVLNSPRAVQMSVFVVRAFVKMRALLLSQTGLARKLAELEKKLTERLDVHERVITDIIQQIMLLLNPPEEPQPPRKPIGFLTKERHAVYQAQTRRNSPRGNKYYVTGIAYSWESTR